MTDKKRLELIKESDERLQNIYNYLEEKFIDLLILEVTYSYMDLIKNHNDSKENVLELIEEYREVLEPDITGFSEYGWIALAYFQHEVGRLIKMVKDKALSVLDHEIEHYPTMEEPLLTLEDLKDMKDKITSPMLPKVKIPKPKKFKCIWKNGDIFAFKLDGMVSVKKGGTFIV